MSYGRSVILGILIGTGLAITFVSGFLLRGYIDRPIVSAADGVEGVPGYPLLDEVQTLLDQAYFREQPTYLLRQYAAVRGMLSSLEDKNTFFIDPPVARSESQALAGTYGGVGVQIKRNSDGLFELYPFVDGPAMQAGFRDADVLVSINEQVIDASFQIDVVDQLLRGEVKDENGVTIKVSRGEEEYERFVQFAVINIPSVVWRIEDEAYGYIQILRFTNRTPGELDQALQELSAAQVDGLIIDLRNNSGGLLEESVKVAGQLLGGGPVVIEVNRSGERIYEAEAGAFTLDMPMVVLVNGRTASAAELVAGAIRDRERGTLIGQKTFGKGSVQQIFALSDGSSVHITSAQWLTPNRTPIDGLGLQPDVEMIPDATGVDVELGEAIRVLQQKRQENS